MPMKSQIKEANRYGKRLTGRELEFAYAQHYISKLKEKKNEEIEIEFFMNNNINTYYSE